MLAVGNLAFQRGKLVGDEGVCGAFFGILRSNEASSLGTRACGGFVLEILVVVWGLIGEYD